MAHQVKSRKATGNHQFTYVYTIASRCIYYPLGQRKFVVNTSWAKGEGYIYILDYKLLMRRSGWYILYKGYGTCIIYVVVSSCDVILVTSWNHHCMISISSIQCCKRTSCVASQVMLVSLLARLWQLTLAILLQEKVRCCCCQESKKASQAI